jgi:high-affinity nickel permease
VLESAITLGLFLGVRHASDVDHVCAIASLLKSGQGLRGALKTALLWSLGHSVTFFSIGVLLVEGRVTLPPKWEPMTELLVGGLLVGMGLLQWRHAHCPVPGPAAAPSRLGFRVTLVGVAHGLAGSAAIALLALTSFQERFAALLFLLLFGLGVSAGMVLLTLLLSLPLRMVTGNSDRWRARIIKTASGLSVAVGVWIALGAVHAILR